MLDQAEILKAIATRAILKDHDGETGVAVDMDTDGETIAVKIVAENFARWSDSLDLEHA